MNTSSIPTEVRANAAAWLKRWHCSGLGIVRKIPASAPEGATTRTGYFKPGLRVWVIGGEERSVFLGDWPTYRETVIPEFTLLTEDGVQRLCQYGRDFVFLNVNAEATP